MKRKYVFLMLCLGLIFSLQSQAIGKGSEKSKPVDGKSKVEIPAVVYANLSCELPDGGWGCQCAITLSDDDCSLQTDCTSSDNLPNYAEVLQSMFSPEEIADRAKNKVRITEPELINALILDGFPLK